MQKNFGSLAGLIAFGSMAIVPSSTNYTLKAFDFGNGGGSTSSTNFKLNAVTNGQSGMPSTSTNYKLGPGYIPTQNSNVPGAPTFTNPNNYYDRLKIVVNTNNNPTNTRYAIAISPNGFSTTYYVQPDNTIGSTLNINNYQLYGLWGGSSGFLVLGLQPNTTYSVKIRAYKGNYSGSAYGPVAIASTTLPSLTFAVGTSLTSTPPFSAVFSGLSPGTIYSANADPELSLTTNALFGGTIYIKDSNNGLNSPSGGYTLASATNDLTSSSLGYGAQVVSTNQTSGGPWVAVNPYNGNNDSIGAISNSLSSLLNTNSAINGANSTIRLKAKTDITVPANNDYSDILTFIAAMVF
jgi:hypothetical protein